MNKKMREILAQIEEKTAMAKAFLADGENKDVTKANALLDEIDGLKAEYETEKRVYELEKAQSTPTDKEIEEKSKKVEQKDSIKAFADAARQGFKKSMNEGTQADGGYTVPEDIQTKINNYRSAKFSMLDLVDYEVVSTNKGSRTYKQRSQQTGFSEVGEGGKIGAGSTPKFERISYNIKKYGGYYPITNELLADSDANITNTITEWIGDESRVTANKLILAKLKTLTTKELDKTNPIDTIKEILNVTLGAAFKSTSRIVTNDNGLQMLDTLKDAEGRYLLQPNPANPMQQQLCAGASVIPVDVIPNDDLPNDTTKIPFFIGDFKEAVKYWDRQLTTIMASNIAVAGDLNAFEEDLTITRALEREDVTTKDTKAVIYATYDTAGE